MKSNSNRKTLSQQAEECLAETRKLIKKAEAERPPKLPKIKWVDTRKEMPTPYEYVLVYMPSEQNSVWTAMWHLKLKKWSFITGLQSCGKNIVTHWAYPKAK